MAYWTNVSPVGAVRDIAQLWRDNPYRWRVLAVSLILTLGLLSGFIPKSERIPPKSPDLTIITAFPEGRTRAQIAASNLKNQAAKDALAAENQERIEARKDAYRALGRATGLDVDQMERDIAREEAAEKRARAAQQAELERRQAEAADRRLAGQ